MTYEIVETEKDSLAKTIFESQESITNYREFFDTIMESPSDTTAIEKTKITDDFFNLRTGLAGDVLQKISNYRKRLIIIGDFEAIQSKSLRDFVYESNKTGKVIFCGSLDEGVALLK